MSEVQKEPAALPSKPPCHWADALAVLKVLRQAGHTAYFAGGCVRDLLLGTTPKDFDIATDAPPKRVRSLFANTLHVGQAFGVILVKQGPSTVEIATFRSEGTYSDGRRPDSVSFTTPDQDAQRRDFTINGLFLDPLGELPEQRPPVAICPLPIPPASARTQDSGLSTQHSSSPGLVIDYVGGIADLRTRTLRAIGNPMHRFAEDHLRLLRAVRFAARLGFTIAPDTASAIRTNAPRLAAISPERIADELRMMLTPASRAAAWPLLWEFALIDVIFRFLPSQDQVDYAPDRSLFLKLAPGQSVPFGLALAAATMDYRMASNASLRNPVTLASRPHILSMNRAMRDALKISNEELADLQGTLEPIPSLLDDRDPTLAGKKRFLARPTASLTIQLLDALSKLGLHQQRIASLQSEFKTLIQSPVAPAPLITGDDLKELGLNPGPVFRQILDDVYDAQLESRITDKPQALQLAKSLAAKS